MDNEAKEKPIFEYIADIKRLKAQITRYEARLEIDHVWRWSEADGECVRVEVPEEKRETMYDGLECRDETIKMLDHLIDDELNPIVHAAEELMFYVLDKYKVRDKANLTCPYMIKLYEALDNAARLDLPDSPNLLDKI